MHMLFPSFPSNQVDEAEIRDGAIAAFSGCLPVDSVMHHALEMEGSGSDMPVVECKMFLNKQFIEFVCHCTSVALDSSV